VSHHAWEGSVHALIMVEGWPLVLYVDYNREGLVRLWVLIHQSDLVYWYTSGGVKISEGLLSF